MSEPMTPMEGSGTDKPMTETAPKTMPDKMFAPPMADQPMSEPPMSDPMKPVNGSAEVKP
jgi:hypothetical protein